MKLSIGQKPPHIVLTGIDGQTYSTDTLEGQPHMIAFFRFATCPFCNMRIHQLVSNYSKLADSFKIIAIFDAPLKHLTKNASKHKAPFPILADPTNQYYKAFAIERSIVGVFKGMIFRFPTLIAGLFKGYIPLVAKGHMTTMPAEFLIDSEGIIQKVYYGTDEGDHLPLNEVIKFSQDQHAMNLKR